MSKKMHIESVQQTLSAAGIGGVKIHAEKLSRATNGGFRGNGWRVQTDTFPSFSLTQDQRDRLRDAARTHGTECVEKTFGAEPMMRVRSEGR